MVRRAGLSVSAIKVSEIEYPNRIEAEFYQPYYLANRDTILNCGLPVKHLKEITTRITDGSHITPEYQETGIKFLMVRNLHEHNIDFEVVKYITPEMDKSLKQCKPVHGDILLSKVGSIGVSAVVPNDAPDFNIFVSLAIIKGVELKYRAYVSTFLNSCFGRLQAERVAKGISQPDLHLEDIREFIIPLPSEKFADKITSIIQKTALLRQKSFDLYADAESLLASELGLDKLDLSESLFSVKNLSDARSSKRIDAEYFQPKYNRALKLMRKSGETLNTIADLSKTRFEPEAGKAFNYIEISDLTSDGLAESQIIQGEDAPSRAQWLVRKGDVITSTVRPIRRLSAMIEAEQAGFVCSSGFVVLHPKSIPPELLLTYLRIPVVCEILDLYTTASMYLPFPLLI
ncbi:MAG: hypothetical protein WBW94_05635 [Anaerolineales bacterium]